MRVPFGRAARVIVDIGILGFGAYALWQHAKLMAYQREVASRGG